MPRVLTPLAGPIGPVMSLSGWRAAGPVAVVGLGLLLGAIGFVLATLRQRLRRLPK